MTRTARILLAIATLLSGLGADAAAGTVAFLAGHPEGCVSAVSVPDGSVLRTAPVGREPRGVALSPDGRTLYVASSADATVSVLSAADLRRIGEIPVPPGPTDIGLSPGGETLFVACRFSNNLAVVGTADRAVTATIPAGGVPAGVAVSPDGRHLYVARALDDAISVIRLSDLGLEAVIELGRGFRPSAIRVGPDGSRIYAASRDSLTMSVIDTAARQTLVTVALQRPPLALSLSQDGAHVFLWDAAGTLTRFSTPDLRAVEAIPLTGERPPAALALSTGPEAADHGFGGGGLAVSDVIAALNTPAGLDAFAASLTQINLTWEDTSADEIGYRIERRTLSGSYTEIATVGANVTYYSDVGLMPYTTYAYRVRAYNLSGNSPYSNEAYATTADIDDDDTSFFCSVGSVLPGTPFGRHMKTLRDFRDGFLKKSAAGRAFVKFYYRHSPALAQVLRQSQALRCAALVLLVPVICAILHPWLMLLPLLALPALALLSNRIPRKRKAPVPGARGFRAALPLDPP